MSALAPRIRVRRFHSTVSLSVFTNVYSYFEKNSKYVHEFTDDDHERLSEILQRFKSARVIVSYYDHPRLAGLYQGWRRIQLAESTQSLSNATNGNKKVKQKKQTEILLVNTGVKYGLFE